jgi:hypothetical protein
MPKPTSSSLRWNRAVVRFYNQRGTAEQWIKDGKAATHWTRLLPLARLIRHARYFIVQRRAT